MNVTEQRHDGGVVVACIGNEKNGERISRAAQNIACRTGMELRLLSSMSDCMTDFEKKATLTRLFEISRKTDAQLQIYFGGQPLENIVEYIAKEGASIIVTGFPENASLNGFVGKLHSALPTIPIAMVTENYVIHTMYPVPVAANA